MEESIDTGSTNGSNDSSDNVGTTNTNTNTNTDSKLLAGKYNTQEDLVKGYTELQTAFSSKDEVHRNELSSFKSPEAFEAGEGWGSDNAMDNRMMSVFQEVAKEHNMSQGMYEGLVNGMVDMQTRVAKDSLVEVQKSIENYDTRAKTMVDTALKFLRPDQVQGLDSLLTTKESFEALEVLMAQSRGGSLPSTLAPANDVSEKELRDSIRNLNPADTTERARLLKVLNSRGDGGGSLV